MAPQTVYGRPSAARIVFREWRNTNARASLLYRRRRALTFPGPTRSICLWSFPWLWRKVLDFPRSRSSALLPLESARGDRACRGVSCPSGKPASNRRVCAGPTGLSLRPCQSPVGYKCETYFEFATHSNLSQVDPPQEFALLPGHARMSPQISEGLTFIESDRRPTLLMALANYHVLTA